MTSLRSRVLSLSTLAGATIIAIGMAHGQPSRFDELSNAPFEQNRPTRQTAQTLKDELLFQRATQTYLWAMPLLNTLGMKVGAEEVFGTVPETPQLLPSINGFSKVATKSDESIDIWFGPTKPFGVPIGYLRQTTNSP